MYDAVILLVLKLYKNYHKMQLQNRQETDQ